ncbi:MAG: mannosyltransferase [Solirubrobacteraceae bacterium]|jgi:4-amino-4-deoxy-L-arabinose transferase-like glycosyltransferase|nr:mannosyltransferase [Solirubrobacteraceae bacterium]
MRRHLPLAGIVLLAALLRLPTLGSRSLWLDEGAEWQAVRGSFGDMLTQVIHHEATPPLAYIYEWVATRVTGMDEFGLRLPFALLGIALVPLVYLAARDLAGHRAGLVSGALAAANPLLVWHAQDARAYSLLQVLLTATIVALARGRMWWWAVLGAAALATHHFAAFVVLPEAVWLLHRRGRAAWGPVALPALVLVPLAILAASQADGRASWINDISIVTRLVQIPAGFVDGYQLSRGMGVAIGLAVAVPLGLALVAALRLRAGRALIALAIVGIALPLVAALAGKDYVIARYVSGSLLAALIAMGIGLDRMRWGVPAAVAVCAVWIAINLATATEPKYRREDWRAAARATAGAEAVMLVPRDGQPVLSYYRGDAKRVSAASVRSLAVLAMGQTSGFGCRIPDGPALGGGATQSGTCWRVTRYRWAHARLVGAGSHSLIR